MAKSGLFNYVWNPVRHLLMATGESAEKLGSGAGKVAKNVVNTARGVGNTVASHTNQALGGVTRSRRSRRSRRSTRRSTRRSSRRSSRRS